MRKSTIFILVCLLQLGQAISQDKMVAGWTFPSNGLAADTGVSANLSQEIITVGGTSDIELKNGFTTKAAQASGWNEGMDEKGWVVTLSTAGFMNLTISSRQQSGGTDPGPKYFRLQYSLDGGASWSDVEGGDITVENDWETSFVDQLALSGDCEDLDEVMIRWLMASNEASGAGGSVSEVGKSKIDEIYIRGDLINAVADVPAPVVSLLPVAGGARIAIHASESISRVSVYSVSGQLVCKGHATGTDLEIDPGSTGRGQLLLLVIEFNDARKTKTFKYLY